MNRTLKLVVNNSPNIENTKFFFEKNELKIILDLYAKMVSEGSWKDYGLSISSKQVSFSVFKNAAENAIYKICKNFKPSNKWHVFMQKLVDCPNHNFVQNQQSLQGFLKNFSDL